MNKQARYLLLGLIIIVLLIAAGFYVPLGSKQYAANDVQNIGNNSVEIIHYPLAIKFKLRLALGACDNVRISSRGTGTKVIAITTPSQSEMCTMNLKYQDIQHKVFLLPWQKHLTIQYYDKTLLDGTL